MEVEDREQWTGRGRTGQGAEEWEGRTGSRGLKGGDREQMTRR